MAPKNQPFFVYIRYIMQNAGLTSVDMALWLGVPFSTFNTWRRGTVVEPHEPRRTDILARLELLKDATRAGVFPPPLFKGKMRWDYVTNAYRKATAKPKAQHASEAPVLGALESPKQAANSSTRPAVRAHK